ncbi:MAG TPA: hypothetical protein VND67_07340, partial [Acidimicrobiales bacterium]|nr:hypothetical protein [Acidimicrobiales bacterium]
MGGLKLGGTVVGGLADGGVADGGVADGGVADGGVADGETGVGGAAVGGLLSVAGVAVIPPVPALGPGVDTSASRMLSVLAPLVAGVGVGVVGA